MSEDAERAAVVEAARSWLGTPYRHMGRVKGAAGGVDCATLLAEVFYEAGVTDRIDIEHYPRDWHLHRSDERYRDFVERYATRIDPPPKPGDIVLWRFGRCYSHGAIVAAWPVVIHAYLNAVCVMEDAEAATWLNVVSESHHDAGKPRPRLFYTRWPE
jgi:cell wall-associated NlpC family hydrolase